MSHLVCLFQQSPNEVSSYHHTALFKPVTSPLLSYKQTHFPPASAFNHQLYVCLLWKPCQNGIEMFILKWTITLWNIEFPLRPPSVCFYFIWIKLVASKGLLMPSNTVPQTRIIKTSHSLCNRDYYTMLLVPSLLAICHYLFWPKQDKMATWLTATYSKCSNSSTPDCMGQKSEHAPVALPNAAVRTECFNRDMIWLHTNSTKDFG